MGWGGAKPPNQKQNLSGALRSFRRLGLLAFVAILIVGIFLAGQIVWDKRQFDRFFLADLAFWALFLISITMGFGLGGQLGRAWTHRQRWRHSLPWIVIIALGVALAWFAGEAITLWLAPGSILYAPVALVFGVVVGIVDFRRPNRTMGGY